jgi:hypothetical protein
MKGRIMTRTTVDIQSSKQLLELTIGSWFTQAIYVAAELGIADLLTEGPRTAEELAEYTNTNSSALYRVLRALSSADIFIEDEDNRFSLTPLAEHLRSDVPNSLRSFGIMAGAEFYQSWGNLLYSVQTGKQGFDQTFGQPFFQYMTEHPDRHAVYDAAMMVHGIAETEPMLDAYDFSAFETVMDVGGGNGLMLAAILNRHPAIKGILFDLPAVAERAKATFSDLDLSILRNCRQAMNPDGRILLVETVIPPLNEPCFGKWLDLMMLIVGGRERTEEQYRQLLQQAGLKLNRIIPTAHEISIVEAVPAK